MAGGTHVFDMIKRLRQNQALGKLRYFKKQAVKTPASHDPLAIDQSSWTYQELSHLRRRIQRERWIRGYRIARLVLFLGIAILLLYYFLRA